MNILRQGVATLSLLCLATSAQAYNYFSCSQGGDLNFPSNVTFNYADDLTAAEKTAISRGMLRATLTSDTSITTIDNADNDHNAAITITSAVLVPSCIATVPW